MASAKEPLRWKELGRAVKDRRAELGLSQAEAAERAPMSVNSWGRVEAGGSVRMETLVDAANVLDWPTIMPLLLLMGKTPEEVGISSEPPYQVTEEMNGAIHQALEDSGDIFPEDDPRSPFEQQLVRLPAVIERSMDHGDIRDLQYERRRPPGMSADSTYVEVRLVIRERPRRRSPMERDESTQMWHRWGKDALLGWDGRMTGVMIRDPEEKVELVHRPNAEARAADGDDISARLVASDREWLEGLPPKIRGGIDADIARRFDAGESVRAIANAIGSGTGFVYRSLERSGIEVAGA